MSVKVHEAFSIDSFQDRLLFSDDFLGDSLRDLWNTIGTGSATVIDQQDGGIVRILTGATDLNNYRIDWNDIRSLLVTKKATIELRIKASVSTEIEPVFGLWTDASNSIMFHALENAGGSVNWFIETNDVGTPTSVDSGIVFDASYHIYRIEAFPTGEVHFYIDDVETSNSPITTNIPSTYLQPRIYVRTREDAAKSLDVDYCVVRQEI